MLDSKAEGDCGCNRGKGLFHSITRAYAKVVSLFSGLFSLFKYSMIFQLYRRKIIPYDLNSVRYINATHTFAIITTTGMCAYTVVITAEVLLPVLSEIYNLFISTVALSMLGATQSKLGDIDHEEGESHRDDTAAKEQYEDVSRKDSTPSAPTAVIYARQSQSSEETSTSIQSQKEKAREAAENHGFEECIEFSDKDESGYSFDRDGFQSLLEVLDERNKPLVLDRIDRLGRNILETITVAGELHYEYDTTVITHKHGEYDLADIDDQQALVLKSIIAGQSAKNRIRAAWDAINYTFKNDKEWSTWFDKVPVGYQTDGEGWIEPAPHAGAVLTAIFNNYLQTENRAETIRSLQTAANNRTISSEEDAYDDNITLSDVSGEKIQTVFENSSYEIDEFSSSQLKRLMTNKALVGEVRYPRGADPEDQEALNEPELQVISADLFDEVNALVESVERKYSTGDQTVSMEYLSDHGLMLKAIDAVDAIRPVCPDCNQGMVRNGKDMEHELSGGQTAHFWICPKYNDPESNVDCQKKIPTNREWNALQNELEDTYEDESVILLKLCQRD